MRKTSTRRFLRLLNTYAFLFVANLYHHGRVNPAILRTGTPLAWADSKAILAGVRSSGYQQFMHHYWRCQDLRTPLFLWGDEIEYGIFKKDSNGRFDLSYSGTRIREHLNNEEKKYTDLPIGCEWQPEYGSWMVEAVPRNPYGSFVSDLINVEKSMQLRRKRLHYALSPGEVAPSLSNFPMLGVEGYSHQRKGSGDGSVAASLYISDEVINPHVRFGTLTQNIRERKGSNVNITIHADPLYCGSTSNSDSGDGDKADLPKDSSIHMDAMAFGMGSCCLQVTMQCKSEKESRYLHDQLAILSPILQALSASTPIFKGTLTSSDTRWDVIASAVDDRNPVESSTGPLDAAVVAAVKDPELAGQGIKRLSKSRYSTVSTFLAKPESAEELQAVEALNDLPVEFDEEAFAVLVDSGMDDVLAKHIAHLFARDPLVIFDDAIDLDNEKCLDHFENIQSTNWRTMRWKLPSLKLGMEYDRRKAQRQGEIEAMGNQLQEKRSNKEEGQLVESDYGAWECEATGWDGEFELGGDEWLSDNMAGVEALERNILLDDKFNYTEGASGDSQDKDTDSIKVGPPTMSTSPYEIPASFGPGWRVEFRPLEVQLTDFENAAYAILVVLLSRSLVSRNFNAIDPFNLYMPMSFVEENMKRAQLKDAVLTQKFFIRKPTAPEQHAPPVPSLQEPSDTAESDNCLDCDLDLPAVEHFAVPAPGTVEVLELTLDEIINGQTISSSPDGSLFCGLLPTARAYMQSLRGCDDTEFVTQALEPYLHVLERRARGDIPTTARWIRDFVESHPDFEKTGNRAGKLTASIANDLVQKCDDIGMGRVSVPDLYGIQADNGEGNALRRSIDVSVGAVASIGAALNVPLQLEHVDEEDLMYVNFTCYPGMNRASAAAGDGKGEERVEGVEGKSSGGNDVGSNSNSRNNSSRSSAMRF